MANSWKDYVGTTEICGDVSGESEGLWQEVFYDESFPERQFLVVNTSSPFYDSAEYGYLESDIGEVVIIMDRDITTTSLVVEIGSAWYPFISESVTLESGFYVHRYLVMFSDDNTFSEISYTHSPFVPYEEAYISGIKLPNGILRTFSPLLVFVDEYSA